MKQIPTALDLDHVSRLFSLFRRRRVLTSTAGFSSHQCQLRVLMSNSVKTLSSFQLLHQNESSNKSKRSGIFGRQCQIRDPVNSDIQQNETKEVDRGWCCNDVTLSMKKVQVLYHFISSRNIPRLYAHIHTFYDCFNNIRVETNLSVDFHARGLGVNKELISPSVDRKHLDLDLCHVDGCNYVIVKKLCFGNGRKLSCQNIFNVRASQSLLCFRFWTIRHISGSLNKNHFFVNRAFSSSSSGDKNAVFNDLMSLVQQSEKSMKAPQLSPRVKNKQQASSKSTKYIKQMLPHLISPLDNDSEAPAFESVEKHLMSLMEMWEMEKAVLALRGAVEVGVIPDQTVVLDLLQQLANLGEVECLLEVHAFLKDHGLTTNQRFYQSLRDAYFNSGRIEEGVGMLRIVYHGTRDFEDADMFFTLLCTMTLKHFDHRRDLIEQFIKDLEEAEPPITAPRASLWRCFVLAEKFSEADSLLEQYPELQKKLPSQVTKIINSALRMDYDREAVYEWLIQLSSIKPGLRASVFDSLVQYKSKEGEWTQVLEQLTTAMDMGMKIHPHTVTNFLTQFFSQLPSITVEQLSEWARGLEEVQDNGDE
ncbi:uncharacterized protein LOC101851935 [Aplysia californica]|uniref:Uncharacterized protein LOC101851935 n=1 Tax=Aplysia californica TaxID=6500 RepID=A0ABM0JIW6_APLCA|nr:uncharacterized protein LOC101851935 [Aplysia californica]